MAPSKHELPLSSVPTLPRSAVVQCALALHPSPVQRPSPQDLYRSVEIWNGVEKPKVLGFIWPSSLIAKELCISLSCRNKVKRTGAAPFTALFMDVSLEPDFPGVHTIRLDQCEKSVHRHPAETTPHIDI